MNGPLLTSARYELWQPQVGDLADLFELTRDAETRRFLGSFTPTEMDSFTRLTRNAGSWALWGYGTFMVRASTMFPKPVGSSTAISGGRAWPVRS